MSASLQDGLLFLIESLFDLYLFVLAIRVLLVWIGANYYDPVTQFVVKLTGFFVNPLRKLIPNIKQFETSTFLLIIGFEVIKYYLIGALNSSVAHPAGIVILAFADSLKLFVQCFFYAILIQVVLSWIQPYSPALHLLYRITSPLMRPIQRVIPQVGGIDISPIPALLILQLLMIVLINPLMAAGLGAAFGG